MVKQTLTKKSPVVQDSSRKKCLELPISKFRMTAKQMRKKIILNSKMSGGIGHQQKIKRYCKFVDEKNNCKVKSLLRQQHVTCSICYDIMIGPVLIECGHAFCLPCIESAYYSSEQCPLCRKLLENQSFNCSTQIKDLIKYFSSHHMSSEEKCAFEQRQKAFNLAEFKRAVPINLQVGDYLDFNAKNKWRQVKIEEINQETLTLSIIGKQGKKSDTIEISLHSRRLAKYRAFTKAPPLRPTYYSKSFQLSEPVLQYIVECPSYYPRQQTFRMQNCVSTNQSEDVRVASWDQFQSIENGNNWALSDAEVHLPNSQNFWNLSIEDLEMPLII